MKKLLAIGLIVLVVFTLALSVIVAGCSDDEGTTDTTTIEGTDTTAGTDLGTDTTVDLGTETTVAP